MAIPPEIEALFDGKQLAALKEALAFDPRPGYQDDPQRVYGFAYAGYDVRFQVKDDAVTVLAAEKI